MRLVMTSDCHGRLPEVEIPEGDVLLLAGDILPNFSRNPHVDAMFQQNALRDLDAFMEKTKFKRVLFVAGNHDWLFEKNSRIARTIMKKMTYVEDELVTIDGIKFYGSPWQPEFCGWAFNLPRSGNDLKKRWDVIPEGIDVLITHSPPGGILDQVGLRPEHLGCELLAERVKAVKPKVHLFGHIHDGYGRQEIDGITYANVSLCTEQYEPENPIQVFDL